MLWLYDIPTLALAVLIIGGFCLFGVAGLLLTRRAINWIAGPPPHHNEGVDVFIGAVAVLYGLLAGLIAVAVWEQFTEISSRANQEASSMGALYRIALEFPQPTRTELTDAMKALTYQTMTRSWEMQRLGIPQKKNPKLDKVEDLVFRFVPADTRQSNLQQAAIANFDQMYALRRERLNDSNAALPGPLYAVVLIGAALTIALSYFLALERFRLHVAMTLFTSAMVGLIVFLIVVMDHPFRGEMSIGPEGFEQVYKVFMSGDTNAPTPGRP